MPLEPLRGAGGQRCPPSTAQGGSEQQRRSSDASDKGKGNKAPPSAPARCRHPNTQGRRGSLTWVVVVPLHDADVHGGGRLWHWRSLPLRGVALHTAALHRLRETKQQSVPSREHPPPPRVSVGHSKTTTRRKGRAEVPQTCSGYSSPRPKQCSASPLPKTTCFTISSILLN